MITSMVMLYIVLTFSFTFYKSISDLHMFQQNSYKLSYYYRWLKNSKSKRKTDFNKVVLFSTLLASFGIYSSSFGISILFIVLSIIFLYFSYFMFKFRKNSSDVKKKLVFTARAKRLFATTQIVNVLLMVVSLYISTISPLTALIAVVISAVINVFSYTVTSASVFINEPIEKMVRQYYINDAVKILKANKNLKIVAITGSYGKTSTKNLLAGMLRQKYPTLMTPESFNTPMGVVMTIRQHLRPYHEVFVVEMGAKHVGEIKEICDFVDPEYTVITSIGEQHLETFKSFENIIKTKCEIFDCARKDGHVFINLYDENIRKAKIRPDLHKTYFGECEGFESSLKPIGFSVTGQGTKIRMKSDIYGEFDLNTKLLGRHNIENVTLCASIALNMGLTPEEIDKGLIGVEPVKHRLSYYKTGLGYTIIDDAFNSNPIGSKNALEVLKLMEGGKKFIITPGMIELGPKQDEYNEKFGTYMKDSCDYVILVGEKQTAPIQRGLAKAKFNKENIQIVKTTKEGFDYIHSIIKPGDILLIENDLPDLFNE